jgi:hypothetical protein
LLLAPEPTVFVRLTNGPVRNDYEELRRFALSTPEKSSSRHAGFVRLPVANKSGGFNGPLILSLLIAAVSRPNSARHSTSQISTICSSTLPLHAQDSRQTWNIENTAGVCYVVPMPIPPPDLEMRNRRRSKRVQHKTAVMVRFRDANNHSISEKTHTIVVNDHGALILLAATVKTQQIIRLENLSLGEEVLCRVASLGQTLMGKTQVAVEFIIPNPGFWKSVRNSKPVESGGRLKK